MNPLDELYQAVILDHNRRPRNFGKLERPNRVAAGDNPLCGDHFTIYLQVEGDRISDVSFEGAGCAISKAAASVMTMQVKGKTVEEARRLFDSFQEMMREGHSAQEDEFSDLSAFVGVHQFPARIKCATLSWHALSNALERRPDPASTETPADPTT